MSLQYFRCILSFILMLPQISFGDVSREELTTALKRYQNLASMKVEFKQVKSLKDIALEITSEGRLSLERIPGSAEDGNIPMKVEWQLVKPEPMIVRLNQDTIQIESNGKTETLSKAQMNSQKDKQGFHELLNWLRLDANALANNYQIEKTGKNIYQFRSRQENAPFKSIELKLHPDGHVETMKLIEASGDLMTISFQRPQIKTIPKK